MTIRSPSDVAISNEIGPSVPSGPLSGGSWSGAGAAAIALCGLLTAVSYPLGTAAVGSVLVVGLLIRWLLRRREVRRAAQREAYTPLA